MSKQHPSPEDSLVHTIVTGKYFLRFWLYLGHICSCVQCTSCEASVLIVLGKQFPWRMIIRRLLFCRKARNFVFAMFIWRLSVIFDLGLCVLIGQSELSTLCPVPRLLINSPGYEVSPEAPIEIIKHHSKRQQTLFVVTARLDVVSTVRISCRRGSCGVCSSDQV